MNPAYPDDTRRRPFELTPLGTAGIGMIPMLLRAEAAIELALAITVYRLVGGTWPMFAALFLVPDISMVGYLANPGVGARVYNLGHTYMAPALLALAGCLIASPLLYPPALIWAAHIGFDRLLGYGLKDPSAFRATHLSRR